jgi:hypothetical protein
VAGVSRHPPVRGFLNSFPQRSDVDECLGDLAPTKAALTATSEQVSENPVFGAVGKGSDSHYNEICGNFFSAAVRS